MRRARGPAFPGDVTLAPGQIALYTNETQPPLLVIGKLDDGYPSPEGQTGGWEDVERPGQVSATIFRGTTSERLPLSLILGGWPVDPRPGGVDCERQIEQLETMARQRVDARGGQHPPLLRVKGVVRHRGGDWFVDNDGLEWGTGPDDVIVVRGRIVRARVTVTLRRYVPVRLVRLEPEKRPEPPWRRHRVKKGETAWEIAKEQLDLRDRDEIRAAVREFKWGRGRHRGRRIRDPRRIRAGDLVLLPPISYLRARRTVGLRGPRGRAEGRRRGSGRR